MLRDKPYGDFDTHIEDTIATTDPLLTTPADARDDASLYVVDTDTNDQPLFYAYTTPSHDGGATIRDYGGLTLDPKYTHSDDVSVTKAVAHPAHDGDGYRTRLRTARLPTILHGEVRDAARRVLDTFTGSTAHRRAVDDASMDDVYLLSPGQLFIPARLVTNRDFATEDLRYTGSTDSGYRGFPDTDADADPLFGFVVDLDFTDWRERAIDLALETPLSDKQATAWAILEQADYAKDVAAVLDRDKSTISQQVQNAAEKFARAESLLDTESTELSSAATKALQKARRRVEQQALDARFRMEARQLDHPRTVTCPNCGFDTGDLAEAVDLHKHGSRGPPEPWSDNRVAGDFVPDDPPRFYASRVSTGVAYETAYICPECEHVAEPEAFGTAWLKTHRDYEEPDPPI